MSLQGPNAEDTRKLHNEVNQVVNQRYLVTSLAITVFGVITAWWIPKELPPAGKPLGPFAFAGATLLLILLLLLYAFSLLLENMLRVYTCYLSVTKASGWEDDWSEYRRHYKAFAYNQSQTIVFMVLGIISAAFPIGFAAMHGLKLEPSRGIGILIGSTLIYEAALWAAGFLHVFSSENRHHSRWSRLAATPDGQAQRASGSFSYGYQDQAGSWALHTGTGDRTQTYNITFPTPFKTAPSVAVALAGFDVDKQANTRVSLLASNITSSGFDLTVKVWADTILFSVQGMWIAIE